MVWLIIGCTLLIIVCLGGGKTLAKIVLGAVALIGLLVFLGASAAGNIPLPSATAVWTIIVVAVIVALMMLRQRGVDLEITHMRHHDQVAPPDEPR